MSQQLKYDILDDTYPEGDTLPLEQKLIELFTVSRTVVREEIKAL
ncbi:GntR family transcriptional regulator [Shewanella sp. A25]|nr:GntR family transcriptional regulator [Shewanella shenzhenensis]